MGNPQSRRLTTAVGIGLVNLATITWATNMILGRYLRNDIGPLTLAASRFLIASLLFAILLRRRPPEERRLGPDRWLLLGMAFTGVAVNDAQFQSSDGNVASCSLSIELPFRPHAGTIAALRLPRIPTKLRMLVGLD